MSKFAISLAAAVLPMGAFALPGAAEALSYSGSWPINAALPPHFARTACLTLVDTGLGGQHSGSASLTGAMTGDVKETGTFQVINSLLVVTIQLGSDTGEVVYELLIAPASDGALGNGAFEESPLSAALTFGAKDGC